MARLRRKTGKKAFQQGGYSGAVYRGRMPRSYKGAGLFSFLPRLIGSAVPKLLPKVGSTMMKSVAKNMLKKGSKAALNTGLEVMSDMMSGKNIKQSVKSRGKNLGKEAMNIAKTAAFNSLMSGVIPSAGRKRRTTKRKVAQRKTTKKQKGGGSIRTTKKTKYITRGKKQNVFGDF